MVANQERKGVTRTSDAAPSTRNFAPKDRKRIVAMLEEVADDLDIEQAEQQTKLLQRRENSLPAAN